MVDFVPWSQQGPLGRGQAQVAVTLAGALSEPGVVKLPVPRDSSYPLAGTQATEPANNREGGHSFTSAKYTDPKKGPVQCKRRWLGCGSEPSMALGSSLQPSPEAGPWSLAMGVT